MQKSKDKRGYMIFKIDLEKAYDNANWDFLQETLVDFGFPRPNCFLYHVLCYFIFSCFNLE